MQAEELWNALRSADVTHVVGLPDSQSDRLFAGRLGPGPRLLRVCREGEAFGIAAGLWAGGARPVVLLQNTGLLEAGDALRSFHLEMLAPLDLLVGWRGRSGKLNAGHPDTATDLTVPTLEAWRVPWRLIDGPTAADDLARDLLAGRNRDRGAAARLLPQ